MSLRQVVGGYLPVVMYQKGLDYFRMFINFHFSDIDSTAWQMRLSQGQSSRTRASDGRSYADHGDRPR